MQDKKAIRHSRDLFLGAAAVVGGCLAPFPAMAQAAAQDPADAQAESSAAAGPQEQRRDGGVEVVVVTAEKREEGLQNIPIPITAVLGETLEKAGVTEVGDLTQLTPSLQFGTRSTNVFIAMRGIGQAGQDIGSQSGVTVSLDGVPLLNHFMMNPAFLDVERVEVLRGPQGTIAGRNATGGAINVHSKAPTDIFEGSLSLNLGNYDRTGVSGYLNTPISDNASARVSFQRNEAEGWMRNGFNGRRNDDTDLTQVRGQVLFEPTDTLSVRGLIDYTRDRSDPSFNLLLGRAIADVPSAVELPGYAFPLNDPENLTFYENEPNRRDVEGLRSTVIVDLELGPNSTLTSTTGYIDHDIDLTEIDVDLTPVPTSTFPLIGLYASQFTQEFTFTTNLGDRADLVAGLFYMNGDASEPLYLTFGTLVNYLVYLPEEKLDSTAAYAQLRYDLTDKLRATVGGRYTTDEKSYAMDATVLTTNTLLSEEDSWTAFTPRFVLDYTPNDNSLIYVSASRGFKSGGFNTLGDISRPVNTFNPEYVWNYEAGAKLALFDQRLRMGLTAFSADYTNLQATVFRLDPVTDVRYPRVENASTAKIRGVEFEFQAAPVDGLTLSGAVTRLDTEYGLFCNNDPNRPTVPTDPGCVGATSDGQPLPPGAIDLTGNQLTQAPEWQYNTSGQYILPVSDTLDLFVRADYKWQSRVYFDFYNNPLNTQDSYGLLNASFGLAAQDASWAITGWIRNATDERYVTQGAVTTSANPSRTGSLGMPRMYGVTLDKRF